MESAFDKQIKQKITPTTSTLNNTFSIGNSSVGTGLVTCNMINKPMNVPCQVNVSNSSMVESKSNQPETSSIPSIREKIQLFTNPTFQCSNKTATSLNSSQLSPRQNPVTAESSKLLNQSTPSINNVKASGGSSNSSLKNNSFVINSNSSNLKQLRKYSSTTALVTPYSSQSATSSSSRQREVANASSDAKIAPDIEIATSDQHNITEDKSVQSDVKDTANKIDSDDLCDEEVKMVNFRSVKEKIAYFSSKSKQTKRTAQNSINISKQKAANNYNYHNNFISEFTSVPHLIANNAKLNERIPLANKIEIVSYNSQKNLNKSSNSDDYDSLKHAYKLNAQNNFSSEIHF